MTRTMASLTAAAVLYAFTSALAQAPESAPAMTPPAALGPSGPGSFTAPDSGSGRGEKGRDSMR